MRFRRTLLFAVPVVLALAVLAVLGWGLLYAESDNYSYIEPGLYMGGDVTRPPWGTRAVLNLCEKKDPYDVGEFHRWEPTRDAPPAPGLAWLREMVEFVAAQRAAGRTTYVHCRNGVSRSGLIVVAYLMYEHGWQRDEALAFVRKGRPEARPNRAFMALLLEWQRELNGTATKKP
jgi:hypothetical protein